jgi:dihydrofolate reductase
MTSLETMTLNMKAIVACDSNYGIGMYNNLPNWKLKDDLKKFKQLTIGNGNNAIIMGKNTWLSIDKKTFTKSYELCFNDL